MSDNRVDTSRPEYSWIPFFEELARRLHEDGWRHRQPEIVAELQRMKVHRNLNKSVDDLTDYVDPFSLISMIRTQGYEEAMKIMNDYKRVFRIKDDVQLPKQDPIAPTRHPQNAMFFKGVPRRSQNKILWDLLEYVMKSDASSDQSDNEEFTALLNESFKVRNAGIQSMSGALYWIQPHRFMKIDTIDHFLGGINYRNSAQLYLDRLNLIRERDRRPFPQLNNEEWFVRQFLKGPDKFPVWQIRGGIGFEFVDQFLSGNYSAISFGVDNVNLSDEMTAKERDAACLRANPDLKPNALSQIGKFAWDVRRQHVIVMPVSRNGTKLRYGFVSSDRVWYADDGIAPRNRLTVCWRPKILDGDDLPLPGVATVRSVRSARNELLSSIEDAERDTDANGVARGEEVPEDDLSGEEDPKPAGGRRVWVVRADGGKNTAAVVAEGYTGTEWNELDLESCVDLDDIKVECRIKYPDASEGAVGKRAGMLTKFLFDMDVGDWVLTPNSRDEGTFYYGMVQGRPSFEEVDDEDVPVDGLPCRQRRPVEWRKEHLIETSELPRNAWNNTTVHELRGDTRELFLRLIGEASEGGAVRDVYTVDSMVAEGVFLKPDRVQRILKQLERKKNIILQGPPGTGKTFLAKRLAYALMGERADARIVSVQFHQSYAYEDFVGGFRPSVNKLEQLVFKSKDGAFIRLCREARQAPSEKFVMLIDEINRGNLSRVFGELLMLIESDKRSPEHAVELQHQMEDAPVDDGRFFVPSNVYIIGTMNLADRSLTGMNVAMRRRFAFAELSPMFHTTNFAGWLEKTAKMPQWLRAWIKQRAVELNRMIAEDPSLDRHQAIGHSFFCPEASMESDAEWGAWYRDVVEFQIQPQLEEYWFDDPGKAEKAVATLIDGVQYGDEIDTADEADSEEVD